MRRFVSSSAASTATSENSQAVASTASETPASSANEKNSSASENSQAGSEANKVANESQEMQPPKSALIRSQLQSTMINESQEMQLPKSAANANEQQTANDSKAQQNAVNLQPVDPDYPSGMYKDPEESHYSYWWAQSDDGNYNVVLSTDRNGSGNVYVRLLDKDGKNILCDKNHNLVEYITISKSGHETIIARNVHYNWFGNKYYTYDTVDTVYNDGQSGLFQGNGDRWKSKFNVFNLKADEDAKNKSYGDISFMIPQMETQTISYVDEKGNPITDNNGKKVEPIQQQGLDGQKYTTEGSCQVIDGYFAIEPSNGHGYMSPFGKKDVSYTKDWHNGLTATFTEVDTATGKMQVVVKYDDGNPDHYFETKIDLKPDDQPVNVVYYSDWQVEKSVNIHSIYIPQTIDVKYVYEKLGNLITRSDSKDFPAEYKYSKQYPNDEKDATKAGNVTVHKVDGYTAMINGKAITFDAEGNYTFNPSAYVGDQLGKDIVVDYVANAQHAVINYVDGDDGNKLLDSDKVDGFTGETINYSTKNKLSEDQFKNYELKNDGFPAGAKFDDDDDVDQTYTVVLGHKHQELNPTNDPTEAQKTIKQTINYQYANGKKASDSNVQFVTLERTGDKDLATNQIKWSAWSTKTTENVTSPKIKGYTPDQESVQGVTYTGDSKENNVITVTYNANAQHVVINYVDADNGNEQLDQVKVHGHTDETVDYGKANDRLNEFINNGYILVDNEFARRDEAKTFDNIDETDQVYTVTLKHATTIVTPDQPKTPAEILPDNPNKHYPEGVAKDDLNKTVTRTINITTPDGKTQTITQKAEFTRNATVDEVTGEVTYGPWSEKSIVLESVDVPDIPGYTPSATVPEITVTPDDGDIVINITYKKNDSGKADQGGNTSNGGQVTNGNSNNQTGQAQSNTNTQKLPQTGNANNNEKGVLGLAGAMFAAALGLGFGSKKKRHEN